MGKKSLVGNAMARPDLVSLAYQKGKREGFLSVFREAMARLDQPITLGYSSAGTIIEVGTAVRGFAVGDRVGVAWIFSACGKCAYCASGRENLCAGFQATGRDSNGGYAEYMTAQADYVHPIPDGLSDAEAAPLLCAGAVGYRALMLTGIDDGATLGLYGFGASNHLVLKTAQKKYPQLRIFVFSRNLKERIQCASRFSSFASRRVAALAARALRH